MYGMKPKDRFIRRALELFARRSKEEVVVLFHRDATIQLNGLLCDRTAWFPTGALRVPDSNEVLQRLTPFIAAFAVQDANEDVHLKVEWRKACRALATREEAFQDHLLFSSPSMMMTFTCHAAALPDLTRLVPTSLRTNNVKNRQVRHRQPASVIRPTTIKHIQQCVQWALKYGVSLTIISGSHSGHCLLFGVVAIEMSAFDQIHIERDRKGNGHDRDALVIVEAGCKSGEPPEETRKAAVHL